MNKDDFLTMRNHMIISIDDVIDSTPFLTDDIKDGLFTEISDLICDRLHPNGLIAEQIINVEN